MKKILLLVFVWVMVEGCGPKCQDDPDLTIDELSWVNCYSNRQILIFKSDSGSIDTLIAKKHIDSNNQRTDNNGCIHNYQNAVVAIDSNSGGTLFNIRVQHGNKYYPYSGSYTGGLAFAGIDAYQNFGLSSYSFPTPQNNALINGTYYNNVYVMLSGIYYTKQNGIISFNDNNGVQWIKIN
jgi:hypothetical protein